MKRIVKTQAGLAVDIDETLSWTIGWWVERMQKEFGNPENLTIHELVRKYRYTQLVPYWQHEKAMAWMEAHRESDETQEQLPVIAGATEALNKIHKKVPIRFYATARPVSVRKGTEKWLRKHGFPRAPITFRPSNIAHNNANQWKAKYVAALYPGVLGIIDDHPGIVEHLPADYQGTIYLFNSTKRPVHPARVIPCPTWEDVLREILGN